MSAHSSNGGAAVGRTCRGCGAPLARDNTGRLCGLCLRNQQDHLLTPPAHLPDGFWDTDEFLAAFKARHIGKVLKAYRNHEHHRRIYGKAISQTTLGHWLKLDQPGISTLERARKPEVNTDVIEDYAKILHIPRRLLWIVPKGHTLATFHGHAHSQGDNNSAQLTISSPQNSTREDGESSTLLSASAKGSELLIASNIHSNDLDSLGGIVEQLAISYLASPAKPMLTQGMEVQQELASRFKVGAIRPRELADFYVALGRVSGILAYAALDFGRSDIARQHIGAAWHMAEMAEDNELKAWVRGTQSLIARFDQKWAEATFYVGDGMRYAGAGTSHLRLLSGAAQCAANLGDVERAIEYLNQAERERDTVGKDSIEGIFGFSRAKQWYYGGSSLMWLPERHALERAEKSSEAAIETWEHETHAQRSLDDEALAHIYLATARIQLHNLDGAMEAVRPILQLPADRQISWISKRVANLGSLLDSKYYSKSPEAKAARDEFRAYSA